MDRLHLPFSDDRFGSGEDYARIYFDRYSEPVSFLGAAGSATTVALEKAIHCACNSPLDVGRNLRTLKFSSFYGDVEFDKLGRNVAKAHYAVQMKLVDGELRDIPLWPLEVAEGRRPHWPLS